MQQNLRVGAVRIGALGLLAPVVDQRSMAVRPTSQTLAALGAAAVFSHSWFLAPVSATAALPRRPEVGYRANHRG
jgi:hypothetical protein